MLHQHQIQAEIYAGNSKDTLPAFLERHGEQSVDFAFIDGGHSVDTIRSDWEHVKKIIKPGGVVVFDDYYEGMPVSELEKYGCNKVLYEDGEDYAFVVLPIADPVKGGGKTKMAMVRC